MKKLAFTLILLLGLAAWASAGSARDSGYVAGVIDGKTADRVHLREKPSASSKSLGLYFTGTAVLCEPGPGGEWAWVIVGSEAGYINTQYLYRGGDPGGVRPRQPTGVVRVQSAGGRVNLRAGPSLTAAVAGTCYAGERVTVLGETATRWYYVQAGGLYGYILADYLSVSDSGASGIQSGAGYVAGVIDGKTADRVHLREKPSASSKSLGLYFTGTAVLCEPGPGGEWAWVIVGSEAGYISTQYLYRGGEPGGVRPRQPTGVVRVQSAGGRVNLRAGPSLTAAVAGTCYAGERVTVLGETATRWYYVQAGGLYGYILADYLSVGDPGPSGGSAPQGYEMLLYSAAPNAKSSIRVQYPRFTGPGVDALNALVYAKAVSFGQDVFASYSGDIGLTIDYQCAVTLRNSKIVSMVFWGYSDVEGSAHPFTDLVPLNIDLSSLREITFTDLYATNAEFGRVFFEKAFFPTNPVTSYDAASFREMLELQTSAYQSGILFSMPGGVACFLKPDGIVLSMGSVHATGSDHFEAQLRYGDIQGFYRPAQNYWED